MKSLLLANPAEKSKESPIRAHSTHRPVDQKISTQAASILPFLSALGNTTVQRWFDSTIGTGRGRESSPRFTEAHDSSSSLDKQSDTNLSTQASHSAPESILRGLLDDAADFVGDSIGSAAENIGSAGASVANAVADAFDLRQNEAAWDLWEDYQEALGELQEFSSMPHQTTDFQPDSGLGFFDALYDSATGTLSITVKCGFTFVNGTALEFPNAPNQELVWTDAQKNDWKSRYLATISST